MPINLTAYRDLIIEDVICILRYISSGVSTGITDYGETIQAYETAIINFKDRRLEDYYKHGSTYGVAQMEFESDDFREAYTNILRKMLRRVWYDPTFILRAFRMGQEDEVRVELFAIMKTASELGGDDCLMNTPKKNGGPQETEWLLPMPPLVDESERTREMKRVMEEVAVETERVEEEHPTVQEGFEDEKSDIAEARVLNAIYRRRHPDIYRETQYDIVLTWPPPLNLTMLENVRYVRDYIRTKTGETGLGGDSVRASMDPAANARSHNGMLMEHLVPCAANNYEDPLW